MKLRSIIVLTFLFSLAIQGMAQISWKKQEAVDNLPLQLFHSPQSINLPTAETLQKGDFEFEISHRFLPSIKDGSKNLYGFDGPVNMRLALGYAVTDDLVLTLGRSNVDDNFDLRGKYRLLQFKETFLPLLVGVQFGIAKNTQPIRQIASSGRAYQYFGQIIFNTMIDKKLGIGLVPSYLYNSNIYRADVQNSFTLGMNLQYYISNMVSVLAEFNPTVNGYLNRFNSAAFGFELETGGHFFKIILTNNAKLNPAQFLSGADKDFGNGEWRLGFNITRLLKF
ncbi:MAG: hypothetical protein GW805_06470 [Ignavibacteria bacterium]|nr:hypothetical protein [Ignavibacteria bacterium]NCS81279.1 hypothetical protein [Ignavibacteria bacterium]OIO19361.1 MAG: hypothetical protein AUJ54_06690 [Ignavibacteria bacterium CG1_02_37_35]PIS46372.1 MAG: hypothetical protein COT22_00315 [Ignavibacteria bacterium CG08_land_8_20_14_0_20_37_9]PIX94533.1 MAG: hypothetical protein COZ25_05070 [Ignavibacteria bacterium CG_4_10_14_3_um_filter_37_18]